MASRESQEVFQFFIADIALMGRPKCRAESGNPMAAGRKAKIAMAKFGFGRLNPKEKSTCPKKSARNAPTET